MKISIIGAAGVLGSCDAFNIIVHKLADELVLIDPWESMLKSHWMDLSTAATGTDMEVRMGPYEDMAGSDIIIDTAGAPSGQIKSRSELLPSNLAIIKEHAEKINRYCPEAIVIMETNPVDPLNYAMYLASRNRDRRKYIGYSINDSIRFRMWSAEALCVKASGVDGLVIGEHGHSQVMLFSTLKLDGKPVSLHEETKKKIKAQPPIMLEAYESLTPKRTAGWTSAIGTVTYIQAITSGKKEVVPCNAVLDGEYGIKRVSMTVPTILGKEGIQDIRELELASDEKEGVKHTVEVLTPFMRIVEESLGIKS